MNRFGNTAHANVHAVAAQRILLIIAVAILAVFFIYPTIQSLRYVGNPSSAVILDFPKVPFDTIDVTPTANTATDVAESDSPIHDVASESLLLTRDRRSKNDTLSGSSEIYYIGEYRRVRSCVNFNRELHFWYPHCLETISTWERYLTDHWNYINLGYRVHAWDMPEGPVEGIEKRELSLLQREQRPNNTISGISEIYYIGEYRRINSCVAFYQQLGFWYPHCWESAANWESYLSDHWNDISLPYRYHWWEMPDNPVEDVEKRGFSDQISEPNIRRDDALIQPDFLKGATSPVTLRPKKTNTPGASRLHASDSGVRRENSLKTASSANPGHPQMSTRPLTPRIDALGRFIGNHGPITVGSVGSSSLERRSQPSFSASSSDTRDDFPTFVRNNPELQANGNIAKSKTLDSDLEAIGIVEFERERERIQPPQNPQPTRQRSAPQSRGSGSLETEVNIKPGLDLDSRGANDGASELDLDTVPRWHKSVTPTARRLPLIYTGWPNEPKNKPPHIRSLEAESEETSDLNVDMVPSWHKPIYTGPPKPRKKPPPAHNNVKNIERVSTELGKVQPPHHRPRVPPSEDGFAEHPDSRDVDATKFQHSTPTVSQDLSERAMDESEHPPFQTVSVGLPHQSHPPLSRRYSPFGYLQPQNADKDCRGKTGVDLKACKTKVSNKNQRILSIAIVLGVIGLSFLTLVIVDKVRRRSSSRGSSDPLFSNAKTSANYMSEPRLAPYVPPMMDGANDGWTNWMMSKQEASQQLSPPSRGYAPRIPSLTLPKPSLATVRKASGLGPDMENMREEKQSLKSKWKSNSKLKWNTTV